MHALPTLFSRGSLGFDPRMIRQAGSAGGGVNFLQLIFDTVWIYIHFCGRRRFGSKPRASTELAVGAALCHGSYFGAFGPGAHGRVMLPDPDDTSEKPRSMKYRLNYFTNNALFYLDTRRGLFPDDGGLISIVI